MNKAALIRTLIESGNAADLYDLMRGLSVHNLRLAVDDASQELPSLHLTRLVGAARNHVHFISKFGSGETHVVEHGAHYFAYHQKFELWLAEEAPGVLLEELKSLAVANNLPS
jgi:hypothetical protein